MNNYQNIASKLVDDAIELGYGEGRYTSEDAVRDALAEARHDGAAVAFGLLGMATAIQEHEADRCADCGHWGEPVQYDPRTLCSDYEACERRRLANDPRCEMCDAPAKGQLRAVGWVRFCSAECAEDYVNSK